MISNTIQMSESYEQIQILYEIALNIGEGTNLRNTASKALSTYLRKLNCFAGAIYHAEELRGQCWYSLVNSIPARIERNQSFQEVMEQFNQKPDECGRSLGKIKFPLIKKCTNNTMAYAMKLNDFGLIVFFKKDTELPIDLLYALKPLNKKLGDSLQSYLVKEELKIRSEALEASQNSILITDNQGNIEWANRAWSDLNGYDTNEIIGIYSNINKSEFNDKQHFEEMWKTLTSGKVWKGNLINKRKDNTLYNADITITPVFDAKNNINHFISISQDITERILAEEKLKKSESLLSTLVETIPDMVWLKDTNGKYLACNPKFENLFGTKEENIIGKTDYQFVDIAIADSFIHYDNQAINNRHAIINEEIVFFKSDGHSELLETIRTPMFDQNGAVIGVLGIGRDITDRKLSEDALLESKSRFEEMANLLPQPIWEIDLSGKLKYVNKAAFQIFEYDKKDFDQGINFLEVISPSDRNRIKEVFHRKMAGEKSGDYEFLCLKKSGESFPAMIYSAPIFKNGETVGVRGIVLDITNLKTTQESLQRTTSLQEILIKISTHYINISEEKMDDAINNALEEMGLFVDADRAYIFDYNFENQTTSNTYEWCREEIEAQIDELQNVPLEAIPQWTSQHLQNLPVYVEDVFSLEKTNPLREILEPQQIKSLIAVPMYNNNSCIGFLGFDSVRKHHSYSQKEQSILEVFAQIVVNLQNRSRAEQNLKIAKEKAEKAEKAQFSFLSTMSHEIRTPLNAVVGITNILLLESPNPSQMENLNTLKFSANNLLNIINDILDYNKLISGNLNLDYQDFSLSEVINGMYLSMSNLASAKDLDLEYQLDERIPEVLIGDSTRLLQIINNLISNALKFTKQGKVQLNIQLTEKQNENYKILFEIIDTGIGIPEDKYQTIFEEFQQTSTSITREYGGTGLGLPIVKKLLTAMDSDILMKSELNKGTTFCFSLWMKKGDKTKINQNHQIVKFDDSLKNIKVLLVEDNKINQMVALKFLQEWQCKIDIADNGQIALEKIEIHEYDVILMDLHMPIMDGYTTTYHIRHHNNERIKQIPIVALSASALGEVENKAKRYGMDDFITKPFNPTNLFKILIKQTLVRKEQNRKHFKKM